MLRLTVEIIPHGIESAKREIGSMIIINDGSGNIKSGNYIYSIQSESKQIDGKINNFERARGFWCLIKEILSKTDLTKFYHELGL